MPRRERGVQRQREALLLVRMLRAVAGVRPAQIQVPDLPPPAKQGSGLCQRMLLHQALLVAITVALIHARAEHLTMCDSLRSHTCAQHASVSVCICRLCSLNPKAGPVILHIS